MCTNGCVDAVPKSRPQRITPGSGTLLLTLMPKFGCPLCWPVLTALLGFFGRHIEALNGLFIGVAVVALVIVCISCLRNPQNRIQSMLLGICLVILLGYRLSLLPAGVTYLAGAVVAVNFVYRTGFSLSSAPAERMKKIITPFLTFVTLLAVSGGAVTRPSRPESLSRFLDTAGSGRQTRLLCVHGNFVAGRSWVTRWPYSDDTLGIQGSSSVIPVQDRRRL